MCRAPRRPTSLFEAYEPAELTVAFALSVVGKISLISISYHFQVFNYDLIIYA